ncbi:MAG: adenylosuccinate synthetase, partial [Candidatus Bipolaricaulota bacterium]
RHVPSGFVSPDAQLLVAPGTAVDPDVLQGELGILEDLGADVQDRFGIDSHCPVVEARHKESEGEGSYLHAEIGSMASGCGALNSELAMRDRSVKFARDVGDLSSHVVEDVPHRLAEELRAGRDVLLEGTQGFGLSLVYGTYPYVTSKDTTAAQCLSDAGLGPSWPVRVIACVKPYTTRAGTGPLVGEGDPSVQHVSEPEIRPGVAIGGRRRVGSFDHELVRRALEANGAAGIAVTNLDRMWPEDQGKIRGADLSPRARAFLEQLEDSYEIPVMLVSTGAELRHTFGCG